MTRQRAIAACFKESDGITRRRRCEVGLVASKTFNKALTTCLALRQRSIVEDPRIHSLGRSIVDDYAAVRKTYLTPGNPIVLAHGFLGFGVLQIGYEWMPRIHYWRGIADALRANGTEVITPSVPPSGSIEERAEMLSEQIAKQAQGKSVNIIAHSMGGLDARYMISHLKPKNVTVLSLTTIASPHHGTTLADTIFDAGAAYIPHLYRIMAQANIRTGAFSQLTRSFMTKEFNPKTPDAPGIRYFSYGATINPNLWSIFRLPHQVISRHEGPNDGLVSVASSKWGTYKGTLMDVTHLDLINWSNRLQWITTHIFGHAQKFNAIALYLDIIDMLAREGF
ncbi:BgTH12-03674 [Blumeria graminis f. sp. triticale]|nr:BgTH12-03674 [Blumeria graminis f. sp. triticale]